MSSMQPGWRRPAGGAVASEFFWLHTSQATAPHIGAVAVRCPDACTGYRMEVGMVRAGIAGQRFGACRPPKSRSKAPYFISVVNQEVQSSNPVCGRKRIPLRDFSPAFRLTNLGHLLAQTGLTARSGQCSGMATSPVTSLRPTRRERNAHCLRCGMQFGLTAKAQLLGKKPASI